MLYSKTNISDSTIIGIWKIEETIHELLSQLSITPDVDSILQIRSNGRVLEKLATLVLLKELAGKQKAISYFPSGRPYLADEAYNISISHTKGYAAIILDTLKSVAIDIEQKRNKVYKVRARLMGGAEYIDADNELDHLLLHWSAKECVYKLMDRPELDFIQHIVVEPFNPKDEGCFSIKELLTPHQNIFEATYAINPHFVLVYTLHKP